MPGTSLEKMYDRVETCPTSKGIATGSSLSLSFLFFLRVHVETCPTSKGIATLSTALP